MPVGVYVAVFAALALLTLGSGLYLLMRANAVARLIERRDNDVVSAPTRGRGSRRGVRIAGTLFAAGSVCLLILIGLYASDAVPLDGLKTDVTVQRP